MGGYVVPFFEFLGSVFFGTGLSGAGPGYILAVNVARVASLAIIAKITQPKLDLSDLAAAKTFTIRDPIAPQAFIYGEDLISGPLIFANTFGGDNQLLCMVVAHTGHEIDSVTRYRLDDTWIELSELSGAEDGDVIAGDFDQCMEITLRKGTSTQDVVPRLDTSFGNLFKPGIHTGRGWCYTTWVFEIVEGKEDVWQSQPQNLRALIRGYKLYDPRKDSTNGGTGLHRLNDPTTWEWSNNPALCLAHFLMDDKFGMAEESDRIDWPLVIAAANVCDTQDTVPDPPPAENTTTQNRYTCNVTFEATQRRREVRDELVNSMLGRLVFSQGKWKMWAGTTLSSDVTLTEANLAGGITLQTGFGIGERYNRVRGKYIAAQNDYTAASYPEARSSTYQSQDNGEVLEEVADFMSCNNFYEAQRKAIYMLRQSRNQRVLVFRGNMSCFRIQAGAVVTLNIDELGFAGEKFFVTEWAMNPEGTIELTLVEEDDNVWTQLIVADYAVRTRTGTLIFTDTGVAPPTGLTATTSTGGAVLNWTNPTQSTFDRIEVWRSLDNVRGNAILIGTTQGNLYRDTFPEADRLRYYWIRAVDSYGRVSAWEPDLTTTTAIAYPLIYQQGLVPDPFIRLGASYWDVSNPDVTYRVGEGTNGTDAISVQVLTTPSNGGGFAVFYGGQRRGPEEWDVESPGLISLTINFRIALRTKPSASVWSHTPIAVVKVSDSAGANAQTYISGNAATNHLFTQADSINVWYDESVSLEVTDTGTPPRYLQIGLWFVANAAEPEYKIDFLDAVLVMPSFKGSNSTGIVPNAATAGQTTDFLRADGTWAAPAGSGGGNVSNSGTPVNNQLAIWTDATTIEGDPDLTWDGTSLTIGGNANNLILKGGATDHLYVQFFADAAAQGTRSGYMGFSSAGSETFQFVLDGYSAGDFSFNKFVSFQGGLEAQGAAGERAIHLESTANESGAGLNLPGLVWREADQTLVAGIRAAQNAGSTVQTLNLGTGWLYTQLTIASNDNHTLTGSLSASVNLVAADKLVGGQLWLDAALEDKVSLYDNRLGATNMYGFGVESGYLYNKTVNGYRWHIGTNADAGVSDVMELNDTQLEVRRDLRVYDTNSAVLYVGLSYDDTLDYGHMNVAGGTNGVKFTGAAGKHYLAEQSVTPTAQTGYGTLWVKNDAPNTLHFLDDAGNDINISAGIGPSGTISSVAQRWNGSSWVQTATATTNGFFIDASYNLQVANTDPYLRLNDSGAPANEHDIRLRSDGGDFKVSTYSDAGALYEDAIVVQNNAAAGVGVITINGDELRLFPDNEILAATPLHMFERSTPRSSIGQYGQFWVKDETPNQAWFTDDTSRDYPIGYGSYRRDPVTETVLDGGNVTETLGPQHINGAWWSDNATAYTLTLQASGVTTFPIGAQCTIWNEGSGTLTINEGSGTTLYLMTGSARTDTAGGCTMGLGGYATLIRKSATVYLIMGAGLTA